jgi:hypothetical protein
VHAARKLGKKTAADDRLKLEKDILPILGHLKAETLTKRDVIRMGDTIASRVRVLRNGTKIVGSPTRADATVGLVCRVYNWALGATYQG